jgi:nucleotide-binding universal stress UspA family protein
MMQREILVPLDGGPLAEAVLPQAIRLARATGSRLVLAQALAPSNVLVHAAGFDAAPANAPLKWGNPEQYAGLYLRATADWLHGTGVPVSTHLLEGDPATAIVDYARHNAQVAMIAMTTHGRSGVNRLIFGSVAETVLHAAPVPLLVLRAPATATPRPVAAYRTILVPLDGSALAQQALTEARALAQATGAALLLVAALPPLESLSVAEAGLTPFWMLETRQQEATRISHELEATAQQLEAEGLRVDTQLRHGMPAEEILAAAAEEDVDLVVMATHGRSGLPRLWLGSVALQVVRGASRPVLLIRAHT